LIAVVKRAIQLSVQDFAVHDGIRTLDEQKNLVQAGASQTLDSRHITGHAVDLVPLINGKLRCEWEPIFRIADAVQQAAKELGISSVGVEHGTLRLQIHKILQMSLLPTTWFVEGRPERMRFGMVHTMSFQKHNIHSRSSTNRLGRMPCRWFLAADMRLISVARQ
jgi:hypothetical protein